MEIIKRRHIGNINNRNIYRNDRFKRHISSKVNRRKCKNKRSMDIKEIILIQCIVCGILLLIILSFNLINNDFTNDIRSNLKILISENISKESFKDSTLIISDKFLNIKESFIAIIENVTNSDKIIKPAFSNNDDKQFRIDEDILDEIKLQEELYSNTYEKK